MQPRWKLVLVSQISAHAGGDSSSCGNWPPLQLFLPEWTGQKKSLVQTAVHYHLGWVWTHLTGEGGKQCIQCINRNWCLSTESTSTVQLSLCYNALYPRIVKNTVIQDYYGVEWIMKGLLQIWQKVDMMWRGGDNIQEFYALISWLYPHFIKSFVITPKETLICDLISDAESEEDEDDLEK